MSRQHEINLNNARADLLDGMFSQAQVHPENTDVLAGKPSKRPDIFSLWIHTKRLTENTKIPLALIIPSSFGLEGSASEAQEKQSAIF